MAEFTPELNEQVLQSLLRGITERAAVGKGAARGEAVRRGLTGGSFEGTRVGAIERGAGQSAADAQIQLAIENAMRQREERLIKEGRAYQTSEREAGQKWSTDERRESQDFTSGQNLAQRLWGTSERVAGQTWQSGENAQNRLFQREEAQNEYERQKSEARKQGRRDLLQSTIGGASFAGGMLFCFDPATPIEMADGSKKIIQNILLGDDIRGGGKVVSIRCSFTGDGTRYNYDGVIVTGSHCVYENGKWVRVKDSANAKSIDGDGVVWSLITERHLIYVNGIKFDDEMESAPDIPDVGEDKHINYLNSHIEVA